MALVPLVKANVLVTLPMHASFLFHQSNLQLAYTTQASIREKELVSCKQTHVMHIQMQHTSL
jgi:hypothetical protein